MRIGKIFGLLVWLTVLCGSPSLVSCAGADPKDPPRPGNGEGPRITPPPGVTLYGFVGDSDGTPLPGVVVSDGYSVVETDASGVYHIVRHEDAYYVFVSVPSDYRIPVLGGVDGAYPAFFKLALPSGGASATPHRVDFTLRKMEGDPSRFVLFALGDPQPNTVDDIGRFRHETIADVRQSAAAFDSQAIGIGLGDMLGQDPTGDLYLRIKQYMGESGIPIFPTVGNHDKTDAGRDQGQKYRRYMAPLWYSFDRGGVHFVCLDNVKLSDDPSDPYTAGIGDEQLAWLEKDLARVAEDRTICLFYHIPMRNTTSNNIRSLMDLIAPYSKVILLCGHTHYWQAFKGTTYGRFERVHGAVCGYFWRSNCSGDGVPNGYAVYEFEGGDLVDSRFKATGRDTGHQIRLYRGDDTYSPSFGYRFGSDYVLANVFFAGMDDSQWRVELIEDGVPSGSMSRAESSLGDQWIRHYHILVEGHNPATAQPPCDRLYYRRLKNPDARTITVRAVDRFGNTYEQSTFTSPDDFSEASAR